MARLYDRCVEGISESCVCSYLQGNCNVPCRCLYIFELQIWKDQMSCERPCMSVSMFVYVLRVLWVALHTSIQAGVGLCEQICEPVES